MPAPPRQMHLNAFLMGVGHHEAAWRLPWSRPHDVVDVGHYQNLARIAERGRLDSVFFADRLAIGDGPRHNVQNTLDPVLLLTAIATVTEHVGLISTASTGFTEPYTLARQFATLDHVSAGRAGWNIVTSGTDVEARNFGRDRVAEHDERYVRAAEFLDVVTGLWDSWEDGAFVADKSSGTFADTDRLHSLDHHGRYFGVRGPLSVPRSPQGHPLLAQAGSSSAGREFAARHAEAVFTAHQRIEDAQCFYRDLKARVAGHGRDPAHAIILPGVVPVIGGTEAEARRLERRLDELLVTDYGVAQVSTMLGLDLSAHPLDQPLPPLPPIQHFNGNKSRYELVARMAERDNLTLRGILARLGGGRGHRVVTGTPEQIADTLEVWFTEHAADGFTIMPPHLPAGLEHFVDHVVPELRRRGLFRTEYTAATLRGHYGLPRPAGRGTRTDDALDRARGWPAPAST